MRACNTCQHLKRPDIDRRLAAGEPVARVAQAYGLTQSSVYRHRTNCLKLASSNAITKEAARGTAALALLPTKDTLSGAYFELRDRIDQIARQAEQQGSLKVALAGLNSIRHTLDSLARLAAHDGADAHVAVQSTVRADLSQIIERVIAAQNPTSRRGSRRRCWISMVSAAMTVAALITSAPPLKGRTALVHCPRGTVIRVLPPHALILNIRHINAPRR
jgi:hypothetical protein